MSTTPWRGTLIFAGGVAAVAVTAAARFTGADLGTSISAAVQAGGTGTTTSPAGSSSGASGGATSTGSSASSTGPSAASTAPTASSGTVTIVGSTVQTRYGPLQLSVTFNGSDITDVQALQYPSFHGESVMINQYAIPVLGQEAVASDSAKIDSVSGATITSHAYKQSLQAAIDQRG